MFTILVIGCDPGSTKGHGIAVYRDGKLTELAMMRHEELRKWISSERSNIDHIAFSIENNLTSKSTWRASSAKSKPLAAKMGNGVGKLQWAQEVLHEMLDCYGIPYILQTPASTWKSGASADQFKMVTGWEGRSNEDTRSAAYFGWLVAKTCK